MGLSQLLALLLVVAAASIASALEVTPGSPCAVECLDSPDGNFFRAADSTTKTDDITCRDADHSATDEGIKFRKCLDCLQTSSKVEGAESDLKWYIYNLRFALSTCLYASPQPPRNGSTAAAQQCDTDRACRPLSASLTAPGFDANPGNPFGYCTESDGAFMGTSFSPCLRCLRASGGQAHLSNFMTALEAGCLQQPPDGGVIHLGGSVFTTKPVNIADGGTAADSGSGSGSGSGSDSLSASTITGIVVGVVLIFSLAVALFTLYFRGQRKTYDPWQDYDEWSPPSVYSFQPNTANANANARSSHAHHHRYYHTGRNTSGGKNWPVLQPPPDAHDGVVTALPVKPDQPTHRGPGAQSTGTASNVAFLDKEDSPSRGRSRFRSEDKITPPPAPSPPPAHIPEDSRSDSLDSFAMQAYLGAAEDCNRLEAPRASSIPAQQRQQKQQQNHADNSGASDIPSQPTRLKSKLGQLKSHNPLKLFTAWTSSSRKGGEMET
ncbi:hypothetical protein E4U41_000885 [Claviceps citrina]|nr:hypothetical protein E4U41_000885 [Claviceps citrina]